MNIAWKPEAREMLSSGWVANADETDDELCRSFLYRHKETGAKLYRSTGVSRPEYFVKHAGRTPIRVRSVDDLNKAVAVGPL